MTEATAVDIRSIPFHTAEGTQATLDDFDGRVLLIVNVASRCGLAPQYEQLEQLKKTYGDRGFPVLDKVRVNGKKAAPLYQELTQAPDDDGRAGRVEWNFEKFLVLPDGQVRRFRPRTQPDDPAIVSLIEANLPR